MFAPTSKSCGSTNITRQIDINVPLARFNPILAMEPSEVILPIKKLAVAIIVPEIAIVGKAKFMVSTIACL